MIHRGGQPIRILFSILFWMFLASSCVVLFFGALAIFLVTFPFDRRGVVLHLYSCAWAQLYFWINPLWRTRVEHRERLPWRGPAVIVANHQSLGDILVLFALFRPFKWVSKASVFKVPFLGWNMILNRYVSLVRGDRESIRKMMQACERWLDRGVPVLLFPEGTRSPDGEVKPFKDGAFRLAVSKGCPVIPVVVTGTREVIPKHGIKLSEHADCRVHILEPVLPEVFAGNVDAMRDHVRKLIVEEKARMEHGVPHTTAGHVTQDFAPSHQAPSRAEQLPPPGSSGA